MFQAVRSIAFSGIAFEGALEDDFSQLFGKFGLRWGTHWSYFGHHWAFILRMDYRWILDARTIDFSDSPK